MSWHVTLVSIIALVIVILPWNRIEGATPVSGARTPIRTSGGGSDTGGGSSIALNTPEGQAQLHAALGDLMAGRLNAHSSDGQPSAGIAFLDRLKTHSQDKPIKEAEVLAALGGAKSDPNSKIVQLALKDTDITLQGGDLRYNGKTLKDHILAEAKIQGIKPETLANNGLDPDDLITIGNNKYSKQAPSAKEKCYTDLGLKKDGTPKIGWRQWCANNKGKLASMTVAKLAILIFLVSSLLPLINDMCHHCIYNPNATPGSDTPSTDCNWSDSNTWGNCLGNNVSTWLPFVILGVGGCLFCSCCIVMLFVVMHKKKHKNSFN